MLSGGHGVFSRKNDGSTEIPLAERNATKHHRTGTTSHIRYIGARGPTNVARSENK